MSSISNSSISIESAALVAPAYAGFHRENPRLTDIHESDIPSSNLGRSSKNKIIIRTDSLVVRTSDFSMSMRVLKGIFQTRVLFSGYFDRALGGVAQYGRAHVFWRVVSRVRIPAPPLTSRGTRMIDISACLRQVVILVILGLGLCGGLNPPLCTKIAA